MPQQTFFNLPEEKREKLMRAVRDEFARVPFESVSINKIIQAAGIPRGSFYQYFEDKEDVLRYLLADYHRLTLQRAVESLRQNGGDIFGMFVDVLDFTVRFVIEEKTNAFCKNLFADMRINTAFYASLANRSVPVIDQALLQYVDLEALDIRSERDFGNMLSTILAITGETIATIFFDVSHYQRSRGLYLEKLSLLKRGFLKNKEEPHA